MPYKSLAQERYFNANRGKMESQGVDVDEWNSASKGMKLPKKAGSHPADSRRDLKPHHGKPVSFKGY